MWNKVVSTFYDHVSISVFLCLYTESQCLSFFFVSLAHLFIPQIHISPPFFLQMIPYYKATRHKSRRDLRIVLWSLRVNNGLFQLCDADCMGPWESFHSVDNDVAQQARDGELPTDQGSHASNTLCHVSSWREDYVSISARLSEASGGGLLGRRWSSPSSGIVRARVLRYRAVQPSLASPASRILNETTSLSVRIFKAV